MNPKAAILNVPDHEVVSWPLLDDDDSDDALDRVLREEEFDDLIRREFGEAEDETEEG